MGEFSTPDITPVKPPLLTPLPQDQNALHRLRSEMAAAKPPDLQRLDASLRAGMMEIADRAERLQQGACAALEAGRALGEIREALVFALEAAREAKHARTLPPDALQGLQDQVDLALTSVDGVAKGAKFSGRQLLGGGFAIEAGGGRLELPSVSSHNLGGAKVGFLGEPNAAPTAGSVEYSQSIASVGGGGPNSLTVCADGAVDALEAGLAEVRALEASVERFYGERILPQAADLAVSVANAIASVPGRDDLEAVISLLVEVKADFQKLGGRGAAASNGREVLRLLEDKGA